MTWELPQALSAEAGGVPRDATVRTATRRNQGDMAPSGPVFALALSRSEGWVCAMSAGGSRGRVHPGPRRV